MGDKGLKSPGRRGGTALKLGQMLGEIRREEARHVSTRDLTMDHARSEEVEGSNMSSEEDGGGRQLSTLMGFCPSRDSIGTQSTLAVCSCAGR